MINLRDNRVDPFAFFQRIVELENQIRHLADRKPLAQLRADKALRPVERLQARLLAFLDVYKRQRQSWR